MRRGTTPTLTFTLPFNVETCTRVWVTFAQCKKEVFTLEATDCQISGNEITVKLSQEQTLKLCPDYAVDVQIRLKEADGTALASNIITVQAARILKDGEI